MQRYLSVHADMADRGIRPSCRILDARVVTRTAQLTRAGAASLGARAVRIFGLRLGDGHPVMVFEHYYPQDMCAFLLDVPRDDPNISLYDLVVRQHGIALTHATGEIAAVIVSDEEADLLELAYGSPAIEIRTHTYNDQGRVVEVARAVVRSDRYALILDSDWSP